MDLRHPIEIKIVPGQKTIASHGLTGEPFSSMEASVFANAYPSATEPRLGVTAMLL